MYELLLKWGLDNLSKFTKAKSDNDFAVLLEAIKTKNVLIVERFRHSWEACQAVVDLAQRVDTDLTLFHKEALTTDGTKDTAYKYMGVLKTDFHPKYYRELKKLRSQFDSVNDIFSAYSDVFTSILHFSTIQGIVDHKKKFSASEINWIYRGLWTLYSEILTKLLRVTSSDLRFWLTDRPYISEAFNLAQRDLKLAKEFLFAEKWHEAKLFISLEKPESLATFWNEIGID